MKLLIVASKNSGNFSSFVLEQGDSISVLGVEVEYFDVIGKGITGYLSSRKRLINKIEEYKPDLIHAHYGLCGLLANLQRKVPVITTFHGCDIQSSRKLCFLSKIAMSLSIYNIFVLNSMPSRVKYSKKNYAVVACGVDCSVFKPMCMEEARKQLNWNSEGFYVLFAGKINDYVKNYPFAKRSIELIENCELIELKGYNRSEVNLLMNACDLLLVTSIREASPQVIKEAMACNRPIVSTDVGDVKVIIEDTQGCYLTSFDEEDCATQIKKAIQFSIKHSHTNGRNRISQLELDLSAVARRIYTIYCEVVNRENKLKK